MGTGSQLGDGHVRRPRPELSEAAVVVVVDSETIRSALEFALRAQGYSVLAYPRAGEALAADLPKKGCLVISCQLPDMNAFAMLAELRRRNVSLPALLVTPSLSVDVCRQALAAGSPLLEMPLTGSALPLWIQASIEHATTHARVADRQAGSRTR